jgi:hypothetical protein
VACFQKTYVCEVVYSRTPSEDGIFRLRREVKKPMFDPSIWSVFSRAQGHEPRTNNHIEGWHRRFGTVLNKSHTIIWTFLKCLREEQSRTEVLIANLIAGKKPKSQRQAQLKSNRRIAHMY